MLESIKNNVAVLTGIIILLTGIADLFQKVENIQAESDTWKAAAIYHEEKNCGK